MAWTVGVCALMATTLNHTRPYQGDETYYLVSSIAMVRTGDYLTPRHEGSLRLQKPPVAYWLTALGHRVFGIRLWSGRVPFLAMAATLLLLVFGLSRQLWPDEELALLNVTLLSSSTAFIEAARSSMTDLPLAWFATLAMAGYAAALRTVDRHRLYYGLSAVGVGMACATKGPFGLLPLVALAAYLVTDRPAGYRLHLRRLLAPGPLAVCGGVGFGWYGWAWAWHGHELAQQLRTEAAASAAPGPAQMIGHVLFYGTSLVTYHVPAVALAAVAVVRLRHHARLPEPLRPLAWMVGTLLVAASVLLLRHKARYLFVISPVLVIVAGWWIHRAGLTTLARRLAMGVACAQIAVLAAYPAVTGRPLHALVTQWQQRADGDLSVAHLPARERGWVLALSHGEARTDDTGVRYLIVDEADAAQFPGCEAVGRETERHLEGWASGWPRVRHRRFVLLRRPSDVDSPRPVPAAQSRHEP